jgi:hypothetical protein
VVTRSLTPVLAFCWMYTVKMECDRFDLRFSLCCAVVRRSSPLHA